MANKKYRIEKEIISEKNAFRAIEPYFFDLKEELDIRDDLFYNMLIAVTEAVNNAVYHGNKCCKDKKLKLLLEVDERIVTVSVSDEGIGFDPQTLADPREPENLLKVNGRGVFLIKELADSVDFQISEEGTTVVMKFEV
jgi:serine/threonine-protein kinase RsbW